MLNRAALALAAGRCGRRTSVRDTLSSGRAFRALAVVDECTRVNRRLALLLYVVSSVCQLLIAQPAVLVAQPVVPQETRSAKAMGNAATAVRIENFTESGKQITRFDTAGDAIDAHDGEIAYFEGTYYLYGTSYDCGFEWQNKKAPFCGFKVYSSPDLTNWTDRGYLFDARTPVWQARCDGSTYGCFRPHVIFNQRTKQYVLWVNVYDNRVGFRVFTSASPLGPFREAAEPTLAVNSTAPEAGLNNGDHDTFVDDNGTAYIAYTDWRSKGAIVIEQLTADYLSGTGRHVAAVTKEKTEAPGLFKRRGIYYVTYSDPNCGYCSGTGTSYRTAASPLGPWSEGIKISDNSCGGQPSFVSTIGTASDSLFLYGSDLWNNAARNEALANYFWTPLSFNDDGSIKPITCSNALVPAVVTSKVRKPASKATSVIPTQPAYTIQCGIAGNKSQSQSFSAARTGILSTLRLTAFKKDNPNAALEIAILSQGDTSTSPASALYSIALPADSISWAPRNRIVHPRLHVVAGKRYALRVSSGASSGCYGLAYADGEAMTDGNRLTGRPDATASAHAEPPRLKFQTSIQPGR